MRHPDGSEKLKRPKACAKEDTENPDWPDGYTYLDRFLDDMKELNNGEVVFVATTIGDYKVMAEDMQELKRYIKQLGEVIIYYRDVTLPNGEKGVGVSVEKKGHQHYRHSAFNVIVAGRWSTPEVCFF